MEGPKLSQSLKVFFKKNRMALGAILGDDPGFRGNFNFRGDSARGDARLLDNFS